MKSTLSSSTVLSVNRCLGFVAAIALTVLQAVGAGTAKQAVRKDSDPSIMLYNQGVELMLAKRFREAQAKFEQAIQKNPRLAEAHNNLGIPSGNKDRRTSRNRLNTTTRQSSSSLSWPRPICIEVFFTPKWVGRVMLKPILRRCKK
jgi:hypothetical protein